MFQSKHLLLFQPNLSDYYWIKPFRTQIDGIVCAYFEIIIVILWIQFSEQMAPKILFDC